MLCSVGKYNYKFIEVRIIYKCSMEYKIYKELIMEGILALIGIFGGVMLVGFLTKGKNTSNKKEEDESDFGFRPEDGEFGLPFGMDPLLD